MELETVYALRLGTPWQNHWLDLCYQQLTRLQQVTEQEFDQSPRTEKASSLTMTMPNPSLASRQKLKELEWEILMRPLDSRNLAPSYYHPFQKSFFKKLII